MNFNELTITCNVELSTPEGITLTPGIYFKSMPIQQILTVGQDEFIVMMYAWNDQACCNAGKTIVAIDPLHDGIDVSGDPDNPVYKSYGTEISFRIAITGATDVDTDAKVKALVINELATALSKQPTDFS